MSGPPRRGGGVGRGGPVWMVYALATGASMSKGVGKAALAR